MKQEVIYVNKTETRDTGKSQPHDIGASLMG
jgi:hypothetical protein